MSELFFQLALSYPSPLLQNYHYPDLLRISLKHDSGYGYDQKFRKT